MSVNKVVLIGNVGKDPVIRYISDNTPVATFTLATNEIYKDTNGNLQKTTEWHNIVAWRNLAQLAEKYIRKGKLLYIEGKIRSRSYTDKDTQQTRYVYEIIADKIQLLDKKDDINTSVETSNSSEISTSETSSTVDSENINNTISSSSPDEDLPF